MSTKQSSICSGAAPAAQPMGQETITQPVSVAIGTADLTLNDMVEMWVLPAGCVPVGYELDATDMDTGTPAIAFDFGILNDAGDAISIAAADGGDEWIDNSTLAQAGGIVLHTASAAASRVLAAVQPVDYDRKVGVKIMTAPATAAAGTFSGRLAYRSA